MAGKGKDIILRCPFGNTTIPDEDFSTALERGLDVAPNQTAMIDVTTGRQYTGSEVKQLVHTIASNLHRLGVTHSDTLAVFSPNSVEFVLVTFAFIRLGAKVALVNALSIADDLRRYIELSDATYIFTTEKLVDTAVKAVKESTPLVKKIILKGQRNGCLGFSSLTRVSSHPAKLPSILELRTSPGTDVMAVLFSSGTTGMPKAVMLSHRNFITNLEQTNHPRFRLHLDATPFLIYQPLSHIFGFSLLTGGMIKGNTCLIMERFDLKSYLAAIEKYRIRSLYLVPPIVVMMAKSPLIDQFDLSSVTEIQNGGAPLKAETEMELMMRLSTVKRFRQGYGLTETTAIVCGGPMPGGEGVPEDYPRGTVGMLLPNTEAKVLDPETGKTLGPNQNGELLFRGPQNMIGYMKNVEATSNTIDADGWLHTGDLGHYNENGFFFVVDRLKELIKYNAYQVAPAELEALLLTHPKVQDAGVIGVPDTTAGELPLAWVVPKPDTVLTEEEITQFVNGKVSPYKRLRGGVKFVTSIPKSPSGKILRRIMRNQILASKL